MFFFCTRFRMKNLDRVFQQRLSHRSVSVVMESRNGKIIGQNVIRNAHTLSAVHLYQVELFLSLYQNIIISWNKIRFVESGIKHG